MCLIPPASVSDACDNLLKAINKLRSFETLDDPWMRNPDIFFNVVEVGEMEVVGVGGGQDTSKVKRRS